MDDARTTDRPARRPRGSQHVLEVVGTERLSPHLVRVHLGGPGFEAFLAEADPQKLATTDKYVKILFAKPELGLHPPYDLDELRDRLPQEDLPVRRTYTVRSVDETARTMAIDFVVHGDEGIAGPWAAGATPGDVIALSGPGGQYTPAPDGWHLIVGDDSAIPAVAAAVAALPEDAQGLVVIEVESDTDRVELPVPAGIAVQWLLRRAPQQLHHYGTLLLQAVDALEPRAGTVDVFAHGEREAMKRIAAILIERWGIDRRSMSVSAYWAFGRSEDGFQAEKREPVGQIFAD